jgi:hypothetical protein
MFYRHYNIQVDEIYEKGWTAHWKLLSAKESLRSLIQANGLDINKNYLILKKL